MGGNSRITEEEKRKAEKLGLIIKNKKDIITETIEIASILKKNGVNLSKVQLTKVEKGKSIFILLKEIKQEGIDIERIIKENNLDGDFPLGNRINSLKRSYKGTSKKSINAEEKRKIEELGLITAKEKSMTAETLEIAEILKENGVDLTKISMTSKRKTDTKKAYILLKDIKQEGIDIDKIIVENGLDADYKFGQRVCSLRDAYKGYGSYKITEEEKRKAEKLGLIIPKEKSVISETLEIAEVLKQNGVDLAKIQMSDSIAGKRRYILLKDIKQKGVDITRIIEEEGLDGEYPFGARLYGLRRLYNGTGTGKITKEEKRKAEELELILDNEKTAIAETLEILELLKKNGVDLTKLQLTRTIKGNSVPLLLKDIEQEGVNIAEMIERYNLNGEMNLRSRITGLRLAYNGTRNSYIITEEEKRKAEKLGLISHKETDIVGSTLEIAKILYQNGVDLAKVKLTKLKGGKQKRIVLGEVEQEGIDIARIIEEYNLDEKFKFGSRVFKIRNSYKDGVGLTDEERRKAEELGLITSETRKTKTQDIGKATLDSDASICAEASSIINNLVEEKQQQQADKIE